MNENKRKKFLSFVLVVATIWGAYNFLQKHDKEVEHKQSDTNPAVSATSTPPTVSRLINIEQKSRTAWGEDPFRPKKSVKTPARNVSTWHLSGIVYHGEMPLAIINKRPVRAGDTIDHAKVIEIKAKRVILEHNGRLLTLTVAKG